MATLNPQSWAVRVAAAALPYVLLGAACACAGASGGWYFTGQAWQSRYDREALARSEAKRRDDQAAELTRKAEREMADKAAGEHITALEKLSKQLGGAHAQIALLSGRQCLDADTVRMLNGIGATAPGAGDVRAATGLAESEAQAPSSTGGNSFASERNVAEAIAVCRSMYVQVSGQLNKILDIETARIPYEVVDRPVTP